MIDRIGVRGGGECRRGAAAPQNRLNLENWANFYRIIPKFGQFLPNSVKRRKFELVSRVIFAEIICLPSQNFLARTPMINSA